MTRALLAVLALLWTVPAFGQYHDLDRDTAVKYLAERYGEAPIAMGLVSTGGVIELFTSLDGLTWTLLLTMPDEISYVVAFGEVWIPVSRRPM